MARARIVGEGKIVVGAQNPVRHEGLVDEHGAAEKPLRDAVVIDQIFQRFDHLGPAQIGIALVQGEIDFGRLPRAVEGDVLVARHGRQLVLVEIARVIGIAALEQQALRRGLGHVEHDDLAVLGVAAPRIGHRVEHVALARAPLAQAIGPRSGRVELQPMMAEIAVLLMRQRVGLVHDRGDRGGEDVIEQARRDLDRGLDHERIALGADEFADIVLGKAELAQHEGGRQIERHRPLQRERGIAGGDGTARSKACVIA